MHPLAARSVPAANRGGCAGNWGRRRPRACMPVCRPSTKAGTRADTGTDVAGRGPRGLCAGRQPRRGRVRIQGLAPLAGAAGPVYRPPTEATARRETATGAAGRAASIPVAQQRQECGETGADAAGRRGQSRRRQPAWGSAPEIRANPNGSRGLMERRQPGHQTLSEAGSGRRQLRPSGSRVPANCRPFCASRPSSGRRCGYHGRRLSSCPAPTKRTASPATCPSGPS